MKTLTADDIFKLKDIKVEPVDVPEWGGRVHVREFSAEGREQFDELLAAGGDGEELDLKNFRARVVALCACDEKGRLLFTLAQVGQLAGKSNAAIDRVFDRAAALNRLRKKDVDAEKKESADPPSGDSPTV
jgi:hypothetical protein